MTTSDHLFEFIRRRVGGFAEAELEQVDVIAESDPWLLASLLQKAIRRGHTGLALGAACQLLTSDPARLWRRLMTIALEDIALGDIDTACEILAIACVPAARRRLGGNLRAVHFGICRAACALKSRTADHFNSLARVETGSYALTVRHARDGELKAILAFPNDSWRIRLAAAARLAQRLADNDLSAVSIMEGFEEAAPPSFLEGCEIYARRTRDGLFLYALLAWRLWNEEGCQASILETGDLAGQFIGDLPDYALDPLRTRLGRRAVDLWLRSYLCKPPFDARQVAAALWNMESAACDRTLSWPLGDKIEEGGCTSDLVRLGLPIQRHGELLEWITAERSVLFAARKMVLACHERETRGQDIFEDTGARNVQQ